MSQFLGTNPSIYNRIAIDRKVLKSGGLGDIPRNILNFKTNSDNNFINAPVDLFKKAIKKYNLNKDMPITLNNDIKNKINNNDHYNIISKSNDDLSPQVLFDKYSLCWEMV